MNPVPHGFIRIFPTQLQPPPLQKMPSIPPRFPNNHFARPRPPVFSSVRQQQSSRTRHEWFEKTVRFASRVNSNLSYTLSQLNKAQSEANNVEQLATVHNKLQEVLSTSINSLIQIRKNLRTDFITNIQSVRLPPPRDIPRHHTDNNCQSLGSRNDNVTHGNQHALFSHSLPGVPPPPLTAIHSFRPPTYYRPHGGFDFQNHQNRHISASHEIVNTNYLNTTLPPPPPPRGYIKVKSFSDLQCVPENIVVNNDSLIKTNSKEVLDIKDKKQTALLKKVMGEKTPMTFSKEELRNPTPELKRILNVRVIINRSKEIEKKIRKQRKLYNSK